MSLISEQVKELREASQAYSGEGFYEFSNLVEQAADTIEELSAKLTAANMERSSAYYGGGWITDRVPTKEEVGSWRESFLVTVDANGLKTMVMEFEYTTIREKEVGRWIWLDRVNFPWKVIAWKCLPEPFKD